MKIIITIIVFISSINCMDCEDLKDEIRFFLKQRKNEKSSLKTNDYNEIKNEYYIFINKVRDVCTDPLENKKLMFFLQYEFSQWATKKQGDLSLYSSILEYLNSDLIDSLIIIVDGKRRKIDDDIYSGDSGYSNKSIEELESERDELGIYQKDLIDYKEEITILLNTLDKEYKDLVIFIRNENYDEMIEIINTKTNNIIPINIVAPKTINDEPIKKQRIEFLKESSMNLSFTKYNPKNIEQGFYTVIPKIPIVQDGRKKILNTYGITIGESLDDIQKYRVSFNKRKQDTLYVNFNKDNWKTKLEVPDEWTRIEILNDIDWEYYDIDNQILASNRNGFINKIADRGTLISIPKDDKIILYHKINDEGSNDYNLKMTSKNNKKWVYLRNGIVILIPLILSFSI